MRPTRRHRLLLWGAAIVVIIADQLSKLWVLNTVPEYATVDVFAWLRPILSFTRVTNTGVAFGMLPQFGEIFTVLPVVIVGVLVIFHRQLGLVGWLSHLAMGMQIGGALGNWIDRLMHGGAVVDFIDVNFWPFKSWPIFNLADSAIVVGGTLLLIATWTQEMEDSAESEETLEPVPESSQQRTLSDA